MSYCKKTKLLSLSLILSLWAVLKIIGRQRRQFKVRPINRFRRISGNYQYYEKMKSWDAPQLFKYTRMTLPVFKKLLHLIKHKINKQIRSDGISSEERLVITLQ